MGGQYSRIKIWSSGEVLTAADLNSEFNNEINNAIPTSIDDYSSDASQYAEYTVPDGATLPTNLAVELKNLRGSIQRIQGTTNWYDEPTTTLNVIAQPLQNIFIGLEFEGKYGGASTTTDVLAKFINKGGIINAASLTTADVAIADFDSTNVKFGTYSYALGSGNILAFPGGTGNPVKGTISAWFRNLAASDYIAYNPNLGIELYLSNTGLLTFKVTEKAAATETTKATTTVVGATSRAGDATFRNVIAQWRLNDENGASSDLMSLYYDEAAEGTQVTSDNIDISLTGGGVWFFGAAKQEPATWDHYSAMSVLPSAEASNPWSSVGNTAGNSVSGGILTITGQGATEANAYQLTGASVTGVNLAQMTIDFKTKVVSSPTSVNSGANSFQDQCVVHVRDDSMNRSVRVNLYTDSVRLQTAGQTLRIEMDTTQYHKYTVVSTGATNPVTSLYIDGVKLAELTNNDADATANDLVLFGDNSTTSGATSNSLWEYISFADEVAAPIAASAQGNLDSVGVISSVVDATTRSSLQNSPVTSVFNKDPSYGPTLLYEVRGGGSYSTTSTSFVAMSSLTSDLTHYVYGDGETEYKYSLFGAVAETSATGDVRFGIRVTSIDGDLGSSAALAYATVQLDDFGATATSVYTLGTIRKGPLPVGLHAVTPIYRVTSGTGTVDIDTFTREITKIGLV